MATSPIDSSPTPARPVCSCGHAADDHHITCWGIVTKPDGSQDFCDCRKQREDIVSENFAALAAENAALRAALEESRKDAAYMAQVWSLIRQEIEIEDPDGVDFVASRIIERGEVVQS